MKKKLIGGIVVAAIALTMALNVSFSAKNISLSDISLANIEALAKKEDDDCKGNGGPDCPNGCTADYDPRGCFCHEYYWNLKPYCWE